MEHSSAQPVPQTPPRMIRGPAYGVGTLQALDSMDCCPPGRLHNNARTKYGNHTFSMLAKAERSSLKARAAEGMPFLTLGSGRMLSQQVSVNTTQPGCLSCEVG